MFAEAAAASLIRTFGALFSRVYTHHSRLFPLVILVPSDPRAVVFAFPHSMQLKCLLSTKFRVLAGLSTIYHPAAAAVAWLLDIVSGRTDGIINGFPSCLTRQPHLSEMSCRRCCCGVHAGSEQDAWRARAGGNVFAQSQV